LYITDGLGVAAIAKRLGCSAPTVSNWLRRCGIPTRTGRFRKREVPRDRLEQLYRVEGRSLRAIAAELGVSVGTVNNRLRAYNIPRRGTGARTSSEQACSDNS
jgi:transposase